MYLQLLPQSIGRCLVTREPAGQPASGGNLERGRPLAERADASTAVGRAQRGTAREREGAFGNAAITADVRYSLVTKHYHYRTASASLGSASVTSARKSYSARSEMSVGSRLTTTRVAPRSAAVRGSEAAGSTVREEPTTT